MKKRVYICQECGAQSLKWQGKCFSCGSWNTIVEEEIRENVPFFSRFQEGNNLPLAIDQIKFPESCAQSTGIAELDRVLGGGLVNGSVILIGGAPGIGKSTLLLQVAGKIAQNGEKLLYISGEESLQQVKLRAERLKVSHPNLYIFSEVNLEEILKQIDQLSPEMVIVDSIQTIYSAQLSPSPGSVTQVRESAGVLFRIAKSRGITMLIIGHITKDGSIAGPKVLEHIVDTVLYFEGEGYQNFRILKAVKNRFGGTQEIGIFEMRQEGLLGVKNPSEFFLAQSSKLQSGAVIVPVLEGSRTLLVEIQALVTRSSYGIPTRKATGLDANRLTVLLAVLERRGQIALGTSDVYLNVAGGLFIEEPAVDLGIICAVASAALEKELYPETVIFGELGLGGETRAVSGAEKRLLEASRLGFSRAILPAANLHPSLKIPKGIEALGVEDLKKALRISLKGGKS